MNKSREQLVIELEALRLRVAEIEKSANERKQAEERFRILFEYAPDAYYLSDLKGNFVDGNKGAEEIVGCNKDELIGKSFLKLNLLPPGQIPKAATLLARNALRQPTGPDEFILNRKDGNQVSVEIRTFPVNINGRALVLGIARDITERKRAEEELRKYRDHLQELVGERTEELKIANKQLKRHITERKRVEEALQGSEQRYRLLAENAKDVIWIVDMNMRLTYISPSVSLLLGYSVEEAMAKTMEEIFTPTSFEVAMKAMAEELAVENMEQKDLFRSRTLELELNCKDGSTVPVEVKYTFLREPGGRPIEILAIARDITERKKMEEQLIITDRLASVGELASGIAHELNNPLTSVIGFSQLLLDRDIPPDIKEDLNVIYGEARRAAGVVKNLLTFARKHPPTKQLVNINSIIGKVLEMRAYEQRVSNIQVNTHLAPDLPEIMADYFQLQQVFLNIIVNSEQAMMEAHQRGILIITTEKADNVVMTSFTDDGPGISKENLGHLFDPFFTTKEVGKGTGLGLSICHGIITEHGGKIYAESELGKGATFIVELPVGDH